MPTCWNRTSAPGSPRSGGSIGKRTGTSKASSCGLTSEAGKQVQALSYLGHTPYGIKEDALFCYATARLAGFVWNGGFAVSQPEVASLYRLRLGKPLGGEVEEGGVYWRAFEAGLVAVNPERNKEGFIAFKPPIPATRFCDLSGDSAEHWARYEPGGYAIDTAEKHGGSPSVRCFNAAANEASGLVQSVELNQDKPVPIVAGGWSKAQNVSGATDGNYAIYLDILYRDGTPLYGQIAPFACGTHDWQFSSVTVTPAKPIKSLACHALFRNKSGKVWFDDLSLKVLDDPQAPRDVLRNGAVRAARQPGADCRRHANQEADHAGLLRPRIPLLLRPRPTNWTSQGHS